MDTLENQNAHCSKYTMVIWCRPTFSDGLSFGFVAKLYHVRTDSLVTLVLGCLGSICYLPRSAAWSRLGGRRATFGGRHILAEYVTALQSVMTKVRTKVNCISHPVGR